MKQKKKMENEHEQNKERQNECEKHGFIIVFTEKTAAIAVVVPYQ